MSTNILSENAGSHEDPTSLRLILQALDEVCGSLYQQWAVTKQLIETGEARGVNLDEVGDSLLHVQGSIKLLESHLEGQ